MAANDQFRREPADIEPNRLDGGFRSSMTFAEIGATAYDGPKRTLRCAANLPTTIGPCSIPKTA
jgi:hypothetical protein